MARRSRLRTVLLICLANALTFALAFAAGEFGLRWYREGGILSAVDSLLRRSSPSSHLATNNWLVRDPELGYKLKPRDGVNSFGIRHEEIGPNRQPGVSRALVIGDSVAFHKDGFVTLLRELMNETQQARIEVVNASVPGYTTFQERRFLERDLLVLRPDLVILQYCLNDNHRFLHKLAPGGQWLVTQEARQALFTEGEGWLARLSNSSYLLLEIRTRIALLKTKWRDRFPWEGKGDFYPAWQDETWVDFEGHVRSMRNELANIGAKFAVVAVPFEPQMRQDLSDSERTYALKPQEHLAIICSDLGIPLLDLFDVFVENRHRDLFRSDGIHLTPSGHEITAARLLGFIEEEELLTQASLRPGVLQASDL